jgi:hypothetical protein
MKQELFEKNISRIDCSHRETVDRIRGSRNEGIVAVATKDGDFVPRIDIGGRVLFVHSRFDPVTEARRFLSEISGGAHSLYVVAGFGFGYHCEALLDVAAKDATILILEKNGSMIRAAFENRDLGRLLSDGRVVLLVDPTEDDIAERMRGRSSKSVAFIAHRGSCQVDPEYYPNLIRIAKSYISMKDVNIATLAKFEKLWSSNITRNIVSFISVPAVSDFANVFAGIPAIVVAAGPSLSESVPFIKKNIGGAVVIAVDTAYFALRRYGIEPHFCVCVDPQVINARYFEGDLPGNTVLVADPCVHPSVLRLFRGRIIMAGVPFEMMKWIEDIAGKKGDIAHGGSVSTNAYDFAKKLGCAPLYLCGQDLAFTKGLAHARGSYLDEQFHLRVNRVWNEQMGNRFQLSALPKIMVRAIGDGKVHTNQKMMIFLNWFEKRNDDDLINVTKSGAFINGVKHMRDNEINLNRTIDVGGRVDEIYEKNSIGTERARRITDEMSRRIDEMISGAHDIDCRLEKAVKFSDELCDIMAGQSRDRGRVGYILAKLSDIDKRLESAGAAKDMIGLSIQRVIHTITEGYDHDGMDAVSDEHAVALRSRFLYRGMREGAAFSLKTLERMRLLL